MSKVLKVFLLFFLILIPLVLIVINHRIHDVHVLMYEGSKMADFNRGYGFDDITKSLKVPKKSVVSLESKLNKKIMKSKNLIPSYKLQLLGLKKNSKDVIFFNGFCLAVYDQTTEYWKIDLVGILGGGECFFYGFYDIESKEIINFEWNS